MDPKTPFYTRMSFWLTLLAVGLVLLLLVWALTYSPPAEDEGSPANETETREEVEPEEENDETEIESTAFIGMDEDEAATTADEADITHRVIHRDGEDLPVTMDFNPERVNFWVEDGVVVDSQTDAEMTES